MERSPLPPPRRVVTGKRPDGRSYLAEDGPSPAMLTVAAWPAYRNTNIWRTVGSPAPIYAADSIVEHRGVMPPSNGTVLRIIDIPPTPKDPVERKRRVAEIMKTLYPDANHDPKHAQAGMHITKTIDYALVISGTITAVMDEGETDLNAGDVLIQRGTNHAWENRSDEITRIAFVLIDGK